MRAIKTQKKNWETAGKLLLKNGILPLELALQLLNHNKSTIE